MDRRRVKRALVGAAMGALALGFVEAGADPGHASDRAVEPARTAFTAATVAAARKPRPSGTADLVVLMSLDGLRPDVITTEMRGLHRLYLQGAAPHVARTISKSATLPAHASMVSGVDASHHNLDFNAYRPERGGIGVPTIFSLVHEVGLPTAMFVGKAKLRHLLGRSGDSAFHVGGMICDRLLNQALPHLQRETHGLIFLHFADPDSAGHRYGWMSDEYVAAVHRTDRCVERVLGTIDGSGRADRTLLIVTSDHGGHNRSHGTRLDVDLYIPWYAYGAGVQRGRIKRQVHTTDTAATTLTALGVSLPPSMQGRPVLEALGGLSATGMDLLRSPLPR